VVGFWTSVSTKSRGCHHKQQAVLSAKKNFVDALTRDALQVHLSAFSEEPHPNPIVQIIATECIQSCSYGQRSRGPSNPVVLRIKVQIEPFLSYLPKSK
jgi:hypothetical protein